MTYQFTLTKRKIIVTPLIKGRVEPVYFNFIVDTGAATTVIDKSVANMMGFDVYPNQESLITGDKDLLEHNLFLTTTILTPANFEKLMSNDCFENL